MCVMHWSIQLRRENKYYDLMIEVQMQIRKMMMLYHDDDNIIKVQVQTGGKLEL